jgi:hypothetical protein
MQPTLPFTHTVTAPYDTPQHESGESAATAHATQHTMPALTEPHEPSPIVA